MKESIRLIAQLIAGAALFTACLGAFAGQFNLVQMNLPVAQGSLSMRLDREGWILQHVTRKIGPSESVVVIPYTQVSREDWATLLDDLDPLWLTSAVVVCQWEMPTARRTVFRLVGANHAFVVFLLGVVMGLFYHRRVTQFLQSVKQARSRPDDDESEL